MERKPSPDPEQAKLEADFKSNIDQFRETDTRLLSHAGIGRKLLGMVQRSNSNSPEPIPIETVSFLVVPLIDSESTGKIGLDVYSNPFLASIGSNIEIRLLGTRFLIADDAEPSEVDWLEEDQVLLVRQIAAGRPTLNDPDLFCYVY